MFLYLLQNVFSSIPCVILIQVLLYKYADSFQWTSMQARKFQPEAIMYRQDWGQ